MLSNCCSAPPIENTDLCGDCKEHASFYPLECPHCGWEFTYEVTLCPHCLQMVPEFVDPF